MKLKKLFAAAIAVTTLAAAVPTEPIQRLIDDISITASAETNTQILKYLATDGTLTTLNENAATVTNSTTSWSNGWYVVSTDVTIADRISVSGTVNLILCDGATLTANKGITVGSSATFNVYAQSDDEATMGALVADATNDNQQCNAGIGGVEDADAGTITINGGKINAIGFVGAGIGSGGGTSTVGTITINGGIVTAHDSKSYGAGIGGGFIGGKAGTINLNGGVIHAAGIGSGFMGGDCSITVNISDGVKKIVATPVQGGACIGSGNSASGSVTVNFKSGGNVVTGDAKDAVFYDTGEGSQRQVCAKALNHAVTMSDDLKANITVNTEYALEGETVTLTLGTAVDATTLSVNDGAVATTDAGNRQYTFTMPDEDVTVTAALLQTYAVSLPANMEMVSATNAADANGKYISGTTINFKVSFPYAAFNVSDGTNTLEPDADGVYSVTVADADITVTATIEHSSTIDLTDASGDFTAINNDVLTGSTSHTVTIADGANITLNNATINGGIICAGTATITLVGTNSVTGSVPGMNYKSAGIQIGGSGTTLTIKGDGSLTANGGYNSAGIGLSGIYDYNSNVSSGDIVIEGGTITANGGYWGAGIGTGVIKNTYNDNSTSVQFGNVTIKGGTVTATGGDSGDGIGKGYSYPGPAITFGTVTIYDGIDKVDASSIKNFGSVVYMHGETDITASASDYFTITEDGNRRVITPKDDTDYTITIADDIEHGTLTGAATAKYGEKVTITATPDLGYRLVRLVVKDTDDNDVATTGNTFFMPKGNVTVSAEFEPISYEIEYNLDGGTNNPNNQSSYTIESNEITLADPTKEGYIFDGWYNNNSLTGTAVSSIPKGSTGKVTLFAKWATKATKEANVDANIEEVGFDLGAGIELSTVIPGASAIEIKSETVSESEKTEFNKVAESGMVANPIMAFDISAIGYNNDPTTADVSFSIKVKENALPTTVYNPNNGDTLWIYHQSGGTPTTVGTVEKFPATYNKESGTIGFTLPQNSTLSPFTLVVEKRQNTTSGSHGTVDYETVTDGGITYHVYSDHAEVAEVDTATETAVIKDKVGGENVTAIAENAFNSCTALKSVTIPATVEEIASNAFWGCTALTEITIPESVTKIDKNAFSHCSALTTISGVAGSAAEAFAKANGYTFRDTDAVEPPADNKPAAPTNVAISADGTVTWDKVDNAVQYKVFKKFGGTAYYSGWVTDNSYKFKNLPNEDYEIYVAAKNEYGTSWSKHLQVKVENPLGTVRSVTVNGGTVKWDAVQGAVAYKVGKVVGGKTYYTGKVTETTAEITPATKDYQVFVVAFDKDGKTSWGKKNLVEVGTLGTVLDPKVDKNGTVTWTAARNAVKYKVGKTVNGKTYYTGELTTNSATIKVPKSDYKVFVVAFDKEGNKTWGTKADVKV